MTRKRAHPRTRRSKAFALPLAVLVAFIGSLAVVVLLERHSVVHLAYKRQVQSYVDHHDSAGIMECTLNWLQTARGKIEDSLDLTGHAFTMRLPEGRTLDVSMRDAQGAALIDYSTVTGRRREIITNLRYVLENLPTELRVDDMTRAVGPSEVSVNSAPDIVIKSLCLAVLEDPRKAETTAQAILRARRQAPIKQGELVGVVRESGLDLNQQKEMIAMLTATPSLYQCIAEARDPLGHVAARSGGFYQHIDGTNTTFKQSGLFLTWDEMPIDDRK
jgi:hypothetical protein